MTNGSRARLRLFKALVLVALGAAGLGTDAFAQEGGVAPAASAPGFDVRIEQTLTQLGAARERLREPLAAVSVDDAEAWLAASAEERLATNAAAEGLSDAERELWQRALADEQAGAERVRGAMSRAQLALNAPTRLDAVEQRLNDVTAALAAGAEQAERPVSAINEDIVATESRRAVIGLEQDQRRGTLTRLEEQLRNQDAAIEQLRNEREALAAQDAAAAASGDPALAAAREAAQMAAGRRADAALIAARLDARSLPVRVEVLRLELEADAIELAWLDVRHAALQQEFINGSSAELRELTADVQRLVEREPDAEQRFAAELAQIRSRIDQAQERQDRIGLLQRQRQEHIALQEDLERTLDFVTQRLEVSGLTAALGSRFLQEQRRLRLMGSYRFDAEALDREYAQSRARWIDIGLGAAPAPLPTSAGVVDDSGSAELGRLQARVRDALLTSEESLSEELAESGEQLRAVVALIDTLEQNLNEALLWWPSHAPVTVDWVQQAPTAVVALLEPSAWRTTSAALREVTVGRAGTSLLLVVIAALLFRAGRQTGRRLREIAAKTQHRFTNTIGLTWKALGWSFLRVLPIPMLLSATGFRLEHLPETDYGVEIIAAVLWSAAIWWLAGHLLAVLISRNGVATVHFEWNPVLLERLRRILRWYLPVQFVLIMLFALAFAHPDEVVFDFFGRSALIASGITVAVVFWRLLAPGAELGTGFIARRRAFLRVVLVTAAMLLVGLTLSGFLLTVSQLFERTIDTVVVLCVVGLGYRLATRALILSETRLRGRRMREQREKAAAVESNSMSAETPDLPDPHLSIEDVNQQTRTLVRVAAGASMVAGLFWVWADMLPALTWLDGIELWTRQFTVEGQPSTLPGVPAAESQATTVTTVVSLQDALLAVGLAALFILAARNLPGLVEILLSRATKMDGAGRYTVATLLRYFISVIAVVAVFSLIGLRWAELQWLVAALTLGLGFGLQEVVANFVSGIIMLFERPVRVGDTITIGEYSGTVARIRTRATTIIDWDNREVVVPNKNFITERLINWTLSDTMTRIVLPLNVSHDADPALVIATLTRIAKAHPAVLADPAPIALLMKLGESALVFELRAYVSQLRDRLPTTSDLHEAIIKKFRELDIKIAFPQLDLHLRDVPPRRGAQLLRHDPSGARPVPHADQPETATRR